MNKLIFLALFFFSFTMQNIALGYQQKITRQVQNAYFLSISDIHYDPFASCGNFFHQIFHRGACPIVKLLIKADVSQWQEIFQQNSNKNLVHYGQDTNYPLLVATLRAVKKLDAQYHPQFMLVLGDYLAHHFEKKYIKYSGDATSQGYRSFVKKTMQFLSMELHQAAPQLSIYPLVGNNDSYQGDYYNDPQGIFYQDLSEIWSLFFMHSSTNQQAFKQSFPIAGYYQVIPPSSPASRILVLNSVLFSVKASGPKPAIKMAAQGELVWLRKQLEMAQALHQSVWLVFHIPVGIDVYRSIFLGSTTSFWQSSYSQSFLNLLQEYSSLIKGMFAAHLHMDTFNLFYNHSHRNFVSFTPAISPIYGNNPAIKIFEYNPRNFEISNFVTYYLKLSAKKPSWQLLYNFNQTYQPACQPCELIGGMLPLLMHTHSIEKFIQYFAVDNSNAQPISNTKFWHYYQCGISNFTVLDYNDCLKKQKK